MNSSLVALTGCLIAALSSSGRGGQTASSTPFPDVPIAAGAQVNESSIRQSITVSTKHGSIKTLSAGFKLAHANLVRGIATRLEIEPGTYRESITNLDWTQGAAANTPLVIEGKGKVTWTGSDVFPLSEWKKEGALLVHSWPHSWGNFAYSWGAKGLIGHRSEMAFVNGIAVLPRTLENWEVAGIVQDPAKPGQISYQFKGVKDPAKILGPGEFGVIEAGPGGAKLYLRPDPSAKLAQDSVEVSVRRNLLDLRGKSHVVLRNITFRNVANDDGDFGANNAIRFSIEAAKRSNHVLIDRCKVLWSAQSGLHIDGDHWTIRDSEFSYNGGSGIASGKSFDILWERNKTNFNVWRLWRAGELGYYTGGFKLHETTRHTILGHEAIGNCTMGAWWDVHCRDVTIRDLTAIGNAANLQFELSEGPFVATRILLAAGKAGDGQLRLWEHGPSVLKDSILYSNYQGSGKTGLYNLRWFGRDDPHAKMSKITAGLNVAEGNIFAAGPKVPNFGLIDDIRGSDWQRREPFSYQGQNNIFFCPDKTDFWKAWVKDDDRTGDLTARAISVSAWRVPATYSEVNPRRQDPMFVDPSLHDYRFKPESSLYASRARFPQIKLSAALLAEWAWFTKWSGYQPDVWNEPIRE